jgi:hypothetical protein
LALAAFKVPSQAVVILIDDMAIGHGSFVMAVVTVAEPWFAKPK